jgi:hypothetical protein
VMKIPTGRPTGPRYKWPSFDQFCKRFLEPEKDGPQDTTYYRPTSDPVADGLRRVHYVRVFYQMIERLKSTE